MDSELIAKIAQISSALEVSGYPKPGNVHRTCDFDDMVFEDFIISGIVIGDTIKEAAFHAKEINNSISFKEANLGKYILRAVKETDKWIANNTNLGIVMLLTPISMSAAISSNLDELRENINEIIVNSTVIDTIALYEAIGIADAGGMGDQEEYSVTNQEANKELIENNLNIFDVLKISSSWDTLAKELTHKMPVTFDIGYPMFSKLKENYSINSATVITFLTILSQVPDTLISRKYGDEKAKEVSELAKEILDSTNFDENMNKFNKKLTEFDDYLFENKLNPGTTADLTASSIMLSYLDDYF
ncbi:2-(5''-triphosphoribosyl)-3'-dephosphocoenzyme-A synthase [Candidatus Methanobinarius endosymbioticus]|uniref:2-(5''-triphosphoribosyl)-3'-dephosphocoenzyme-A synthase n=1 Tax=Candidatus Methanobinarius endosymbioticus TaxID=2006182 RepID=A0A366MAJ9_9EURY|nr:2-(5''-triphosphoribosyl)-3'-dephosphocoenzyme-A synthase [Candidatus Methanobinarius endosymbioticus]